MSDNFCSIRHRNLIADETQVLDLPPLVLFCRRLLFLSLNVDLWEIHDTFHTLTWVILLQSIAASGGVGQCEVVCQLEEVKAPLLQSSVQTNRTFSVIGIWEIKKLVARWCWLCSNLHLGKIFGCVVLVKCNAFVDKINNSSITEEINKYANSLFNLLQWKCTEISYKA